jgi:glycosyltransferase involved in cell wall biosynthesis
MVPITILMPVYNAEKYLHESINSILEQTFQEFQFLIINDGSTDNSEEIILSYSDKRINYLKNERNLGIVATMNKGLAIIDSEYIVRMDADDIAMPERLQVQKEFMDRHKEIGVSSCDYLIFGEKKEKVTLLKTDEEIKAYMLFNSPLVHPGVIMRSSLIKENNLQYRADFPHMEDCDLWYRLKNITQFANTTKVLLKYRVSGQNVTIVHRHTANERKKEFYKLILKDLNITPTAEELAFHLGFWNNNIIPTAETIYKYRMWLDKLLKANSSTNIFSEKALKIHIENKWSELFYYLPLNSRYIFAYWKYDRKIRSGHLIYLLKYSINKIVGRKKESLN